MAKIENNSIVSVIIPTYNTAHFLGEAIQSVLDQTYQDFEIIVSDDGSTDNTEEVVRSFGNERIRYIKLKENSGGSSVPRNTGLRAARGKYIAFLDSDDVWLHNKLELEVEFLKTHPSLGMVYSGYTYFGTRNGRGERDSKYFSLPAGHMLKEIFMDNPIIPSAVLVRKSCFDKVGLFDESLTHCGDADMWLRIAAYFEIDYLDIPLANSRLHDRNRHLESENSIGWIAVRKKCLESNPFLLNELDSKTIHKCYRDYKYLGSWYLSIGVPQKARETFREYLRLYPRDPVAYILWLITFLPPRLSSWMLRLSLVWERIYGTRKTRLLKTMEKLIGPRVYEVLKGWWHALRDK